MAHWQKIIYQLENQLDRARVGDADEVKLMIQGYLGYGNLETSWVMARVLEDKGVLEAAEDDSVWENLQGTMKRFRSNEVPHAKVELSAAGGLRQLVQADDEGHIVARVATPQEPSDDDYLRTFALRLTEPLARAKVAAEASVLVPPPHVPFGIISDIDDTVLQTGARQLGKVVREVLFGNAFTRAAFPGVSEFYKSLSEEGRPIFYVSSSPWNLYDVLVDFLEHSDIPLGPIMLRDWGISAQEFLPTHHGAHKLSAIKRLLETYPALPFILIGDSGQEDPEIYSEVVRTYPERILAIYIRDIDVRAMRRASVQKLAAQVQAAGSRLELVKDTEAAAAHAAAHGFIRSDAPQDVAAKKAHDLAEGETSRTADRAQIE